MLYCGLEDWKASLTADHDAPTLIQHLVDSYAVQHAANPDGAIASPSQCT